jgi:uncharacterized protein (DUF488 family)
MDREEDAMAESLVVYTIGHSNHAADHFLELLTRHQIRAVVDVRTSPYSRYTPHFNRAALPPLLDQHGIEYVFAGDVLGGRPADPAYYKAGVVPDGKGNYLKLVDYPVIARQEWFGRGIQRLLDIAQTRPTAVMCSEEDPHRCHRHHLIEGALREHGASMLHIRKDGSLETIDPEESSDSSSPQLALLGFGG